jgi:hypothetical protein
MQGAGFVEISIYFHCKTQYGFMYWQLNLQNKTFGFLFIFQTLETFKLQTSRAFSKFKVYYNGMILNSLGIDSENVCFLAYYAIHLL